MSATQTQVGGSHYKDMPIQPIEFITKNRLGYIEGCILKYICRHRAKNGREDLEKAKHYIEMLMEMEYQPAAVTFHEATCRTLAIGEIVQNGDLILGMPVSEPLCGHRIDKHSVGVYSRPIRKATP